MSRPLVITYPENIFLLVHVSLPTVLFKHQNNFVENNHTIQHQITINTNCFNYLQVSKMSIKVSTFTLHPLGSFG